MIFNEQIKQECPKACEYFEKIFTSDMLKLSPSIILHGNNAELNYGFALEIARIINCEKDKSNDCNCLNCRWIRENKHPEIKTFSNIENKTDNSKTVISLEQIKNIQEEIMISSEYKRVYIFCAAEEQIKNKDEKQIIHLPLTRKILASEASNALLKSIEEPPLNTYFIFITKDKDDLMPTIISRSQSFYIHSKNSEPLSPEGADELFNNYPCRDYTGAKEFISNIQNLQKSNNLSIIETFDIVQQNLNNILKNNISNLSVSNRIKTDIIKFEKAKKMSLSNFKDAVIYENLTYSIYKD